MTTDRVVAILKVASELTLRDLDGYFLTFTEDRPGTDERDG